MILIFDFGSQYTQLIARRIRAFGVYCEIYYNITETEFDALKPCGVIISGGPASVTTGVNPTLPNWFLIRNIPVLGICYGMQLMALQLGGEVHSTAIREYGYAQLEINTEHNNRLLNDTPTTITVWMSHGDQVIILPPGFKSIATTDNTKIAAMADE